MPIPARAIRASSGEPLPALLRGAALLALLVAAVYGNAVNNGLVAFDDVGVLQQARGALAPMRIFRQGGIDQDRPIGEVARGLVAMMPGRLLRNLSYALDDRVAESAGLAQTFVLHLSNVLYHLLASLAAWWVARRLLRQPPWALFAATLFAVHPLQTQCVAYIAGRRDLLLGVFYLAAFAAYIEYRRSSHRAWLALAASSWFLALNSKENAVTLPMACWLYEIYKGGTSKTLWKWRYPAAACLAAMLAGGFFVLSQQAQFPWRLNGDSVATHLLTAGKITWLALRLYVWPSPLLADYSRHPSLVVSSPWDIAACMQVLALVAAFAASLRLWRRWPVAGLATAWFAATFLPTSGLVPYGEIFEEHWMYLPSFGLCLLTAWAVGRLKSQAREGAFARAAPALGAILVAVLGFRTVARNRDWRDGKAFWTKTVADAPFSPRARLGLGAAYVQEGRLEEALQQYEEALKLRPTAAQAAPIFSNMADIYARKGQADKAFALLRAAAPLDPGNWILNYNLGVLHERSGRKDLAEACYRRSLAANGDFAEAANNLAALLFAKGDLSGAFGASWRAVRARPKDPMLRDNFGRICEAWGGPSQAEEQYLTAIRELKGRTFLQPYYHLANLYRTQGKHAQAAAVLRSMPREGK